MVVVCVCVHVCVHVCIGRGGERGREEKDYVFDSNAHTRCANAVDTVH